MKEFIEDFTVRQYEVGSDHCIRLDTIGNYMEEVAWKHSQSWGVGMEELMAMGVSWAMSKLRISINHLPKAGEKVKMITWPVAQERQGYRRDFSLRDSEDKVLLSVVTWWVVFDLNTRSMTNRLEGVEFPIGDRPEEISGDIKIHPIRVKEGIEIFDGPSFKVRYADTDVNEHVNNVRYMGFVYESALPFIKKGQELKQIDLTFRAESYWNDEITSQLIKDSDNANSFIQNLKNGEKELIRARTIWR